MSPLTDAEYDAINAQEQADVEVWKKQQELGCTEDEARKILVDEMLSD